MAKKMTTKEEQLVANYIANGGNGTDAAMAAYNTQSRENAAAIASRVLKKPSVAEALRAELDKQDITLEKIIKPVARGLTAVDEKGHDDLKTQLAAHDRAVKILGMTEKENGTSFNFNINKANFGGEFVKND